MAASVAADFELPASCRLFANVDRGGGMGCGTHFLERLGVQGGKRAENCDFREGSIREKRLKFPAFSPFFPPCGEPGRRGPWSFRIMKDDPGGVALARAESTHAMAHVDAIDAPRAGNRAMVHWEDHASSLAQGNDLGRDCMRGRCSVRTNSPPVKSTPGSASRIAT